MKPTKWGLPHQTGVDQKEIIALVKNINSWPSDFNVHPQLQKILGQRIDFAEKNLGLDFSVGEQLAFATLLIEGYGVRLSG